MAIYLGNNKVSTKSGYVTTGLKDFFNAGGKCAYSTFSNTADVMKYDDTENVTNYDYMFDWCERLTTISINMKKCTSAEFAFYKCTHLTNLDVSQIDNLRDVYYMFGECEALKEVPALDFSHAGKPYGLFENCRSLEKIHITGMKASFKISDSTKFTRESLVEILTNLGTVTSTSTLTMGSTNLAKLTDEDKAIATNKGWTLA